MPTLAKVKATLWPRATYRPWFVGNALKSARAAYGTDESGAVLDVGALRERGGVAEVRTPGVWERYVEAEHQFIANVFSRLGPGWSFGSNSIHNAARGWFETVHRRAPDGMENLDIQYNRALFESLRAQALGAQNPAPAPPPPTPAPVPPPPPPALPPVTPAPSPIPEPPAASGLAPLSPASVRADEVKVIAGSISLPAALFWIFSGWPAGKPLVVEAIRCLRLCRRSMGDIRPIPKEDK